MAANNELNILDFRKGLERLAGNLWWCWNRNATRLFSSLDPVLWEKTRGNPIALLSRLENTALEKVAEDAEMVGLFNRAIDEFDDYMKGENTWYSRAFPERSDLTVAYFSAEFGLHETLPIYSGGLGVLAGDHCKSASDLGIPFVAMGLLYRNGYFTQQIDGHGHQRDIYEGHDFSHMPVNKLTKADGTELIVSVELAGREVFARVWKVQVGRIPLYLMDTDIERNSAEDRPLTARLYGGDHETRVSQEILLGMGGVKVLDMLGIRPTVWHMNEGHSVFLGLERITHIMHRQNLTFAEALEAVKGNSVFTTHTPVPAGNDAFSLFLMDKFFRNTLRKAGIPGHEFMRLGRRVMNEGSDLFSLTILALHFSSQSNGVSRLHGHVSRTMWNDLWYGVPLCNVPITHVTNGIHTLTWLHPAIQGLYDRYLPERWKQDIADPATWKHIDEIPDNELWETRRRMKSELIGEVRKRIGNHRLRLGEPAQQVEAANRLLDPEALTLGFARRFATYKRATLLFRDIERLKKILCDPKRPVQILFAGKAHPADKPGQSFIQRVYEVSRMPEFEGKIIFIEGYDMALARYLVSGVDVWLNTPRRPLEASGTSGQKAAANGSPNFSVLDGWWHEGYDGKNGWSIGKAREYHSEDEQDHEDSIDIYEELEKEIVPLYYNRDKDGVPAGWLEVVKNNIISCTPQFSTDRMVQDYVRKLYLPALDRGLRLTEAGYDKARGLAEWKTRVKKNWDYIDIVDIQLRPLEKDGAQYLELLLTADLGPMSPLDIKVEAGMGRLHCEEACALEFVPMGRMEEVWEGFFTYSALFKPEEVGNAGISAILTPHHPDLGNKFELGLVRTSYIETSARASE